MVRDQEREMRAVPTLTQQIRAFNESRRDRYGMLLGAIIAAFGLQGIAQPGQWEQAVVCVLLSTTLLLALWAADARLKVFRAALAVTSVLVIVSIIAAATGNGHGVAARLANLLLVVLAPPAIITGVMRSLRTRNQVTVESVFGVLCLYLLVGMFFAFLYGFVGRVGHAFFASGAPTNEANCLYFSFTTLTTVGYGDFTASTNLGHTLAVSEALIGQIYLVTVVSVIVGNLGRGRQRGA
jgi:hypothetical protein